MNVKLLLCASVCIYSLLTRLFLAFVYFTFEQKLCLHSWNEYWHESVCANKCRVNLITKHLTFLDFVFCMLQQNHQFCFMLTMHVVITYHKTDLCSELNRSRMLRLRCKAKNGTHLMQGLTHQSCVQELKDKIEELTGIPCDVQKIMVGYPPSSLDLCNGEAHLKDYPIKSGLISPMCCIVTSIDECNYADYCLLSSWQETRWL